MQNNCLSKNRQSQHFSHEDSIESHGVIPVDSSESLYNDVPWVKHSRVTPQHGEPRKRYERLPLLKFSTYNVRTLFQTGKLHDLVTGATEQGLAAIGVQEHRFDCIESFGFMESEKYTFVYSSAEMPKRTGGVGLLVSHKMMHSLHRVIPVSPRVLACSFNLEYVRMHLIVCYAPTNNEGDSSKDLFFDQLADHIHKIPAHDVIIVLGDFNAQIGMDIDSPAVGPYRFHEETNNNGDRMLQVMEECGLRDCQSLRPQRESRMWTWRHPKGLLYQNDHILIRSKWVNSMQKCRAYNSVEVGSDHRIVSISFRLSLSTFRRRNQQSPLIWEELRSPAVRDQFEKALSVDIESLQQVDVAQAYNDLVQSVNSAAKRVLGTRPRSRVRNWVSDNTLRLRKQRDSAKHNRRGKNSKSWRTWQQLVEAIATNDSYKADKVAWLRHKLTLYPRLKRTRTWRVCGESSTLLAISGARVLLALPMPKNGYLTSAIS
jgi:hypothetical protein